MLDKEDPSMNNLEQDIPLSLIISLYMRNSDLNKNQQTIIRKLQRSKIIPQTVDTVETTKIVPQKVDAVQPTNPVQEVQEADKKAEVEVNKEIINISNGKEQEVDMPKPKENNQNSNSFKDEINKDQVDSFKLKNLTMKQIENKMTCNELYIAKQINYYFGDKNYFRDYHILEKVASSHVKGKKLKQYLIPNRVPYQRTP